MVSYLGSLDQFSPAAGRAGRCRQISLCLPRTEVSVLSLSTLLRLPAALYGACPALSAVPVFRYSTKARIRWRLRFPQPEQFRRPEAWAPSPQVRCAFSLRGPSSRRWLGLRKSLDRNRGPVCSVGGGGFSGAEFAPCPCPCLLPPAGMGRLVSGVSQSLCLVNRRQCVRAG